MPKIVPETEMKKFNLYCGICLMIDIELLHLAGGSLSASNADRARERFEKEWGSRCSVKLGRIVR
jgi:hypothetical protein